MSLTLRDIVFPVRKATLSAGLGQNRLYWALTIETEERELQNRFYSPRFSAETLDFNISQWTELEGQSIELEAPYSHDTDTPDATCYFWSHEDITRSTISFPRRIGRDFLVHWEGFCEPYCEAPFDVDVPFSVETQATFEFIYVRGSRMDTEATILDRVSHILNSKNFNVVAEPSVFPEFQHFKLEPRE